MLSSFFVSVVVTWILELNKGSFIETSSTFHEYHRNQQLLVILEDVLPGFLEDPFGSRNTQTVKVPGSNLPSGKEFGAAAPVESDPHTPGVDVN